MFQGFSPRTIDFLTGIRDNNSKEWFEAHRSEYQDYLLEPMRELVIELSPFMLSIDPCFEINPKKAISRINRDIRFAKDKSPYKSKMWLAFKRVYLDWKMEPTYFFEIFPESYRFGMGFYDVPKELLAKMRDLIDRKDESFQEIYTLYQKQDLFVIAGEKYKKILNRALPPELLQWYQQKEFYFVCNRPIDECLFSRELVAELTFGFEILQPFYNFFFRLREEMKAAGDHNCSLRHEL